MEKQVEISCDGLLRIRRDLFETGGKKRQKRTSKHSADPRVLFGRIASQHKISRRGRNADVVERQNRPTCARPGNGRLML